MSTPTSRAAYFREYRERRKMLQNVAQQPQHVAQHESDDMAAALWVEQHLSVLPANKQTSAMAKAYLAIYREKQERDEIKNSDLTSVEPIPDVAQQSQHVAQQIEVKEKGTSPSPSPLLPPLPPPPHTPPSSSPLLSPQTPSSPPKRKPSRALARSAGGAGQGGLATKPNPEPELSLTNFPDGGPSVGADSVADEGEDAPMVKVPRSKKTFATFGDLTAAMALIDAETMSPSLGDAFLTWVEYKVEKAPADFYTPKGLAAEAAKFVQRHREDHRVADMVGTAMSKGWQGWDHTMKKF